jgi:hypothetical protein
LGRQGYYSSTLPTSSTNHHDDGSHGTTTNNAAKSDDRQVFYIHGPTQWETLLAKSIFRSPKTSPYRKNRQSP